MTVQTRGRLWHEYGGRAVEQSKVVQEITVADAARFIEIDGMKKNVWTNADNKYQNLTFGIAILDLSQI